MSVFQNAIAFFVNLGVYDVVLPFLLVFTLMYSMLEKTKVLGTYKEEAKHSLNAMAAFVTGFLVIASTQLVRTINTVLADSVLLLLLSVLFLMLVGSFQGSDEFKLSGTWKNIFMVIIFVGLLLIFLNALGWLQAAWNYMLGNLDGPIVGSFALLVVVIGGMVWLTKPPGDGKPKGNKDKS